MCNLTREAVRKKKCESTMSWLVYAFLFFVFKQLGLRLHALSYFITSLRGTLYVTD